MNLPRNTKLVLVGTGCLILTAVFAIIALSYYIAAYPLTLFEKIELGFILLCGLGLFLGGTYAISQAGRK